VGDVQRVVIAARSIARTTVENALCRCLSPAVPAART
jgi:hypothetical protein